jgi:hypothetical protein
MYDALKSRGIKSEILLLGSTENPIHIILELEDGSYLDSRGIRNTKEELLKEFGDNSLSTISKIEFANLLSVSICNITLYWKSKPRYPRLSLLILAIIKTLYY